MGHKRADEPLELSPDGRAQQRRELCRLGLLDARAAHRAEAQQRLVHPSGSQARGLDEEHLAAAAAITHNDSRVATVAHLGVGCRQLGAARTRRLENGGGDGAMGDAERFGVGVPVRPEAVAAALRILGGESRSATASISAAWLPSASTDRIAFVSTSSLMSRERVAETASSAAATSA